MPTPGSAVYVLDYPVSAPPSGVTAGQATQRATVAAATAATLHSLAPIPLRTTNPPTSVQLQVEFADAASPVFYTADGLTTATATGCFQVAIAPGMTRIPFAAGLAAGNGISLYSTAGAHVVVFYEWI